MRLFCIGAYVYLNIDLIQEVYTDENKVLLSNGQEYSFCKDVFEELLEVLKPSMFGSQCEFNEKDKG